VHIQRQTSRPRASYALRARSSDELRSLQAAFREQHVVTLRGLLRGRMLRDVIAEVAAAPFDTADDADIARESRMDAAPVLARLIFLANDPQLVRFVREVTECHDIGHFMGRVYRFEANSDHFDSWHSDAVGTRRVALSLNLSQGPIEGGDLLIRAKGSAEPPPTRYGRSGDALLFRVSEHLEHRVLPVRSRMARTAFVGWYSAGPSFVDLFERPG
jgi:2OG-Fe(II) oxygenase superfamily